MDAGNPTTYLWTNWDLLRKYAWPILPNGVDYDGIYVMGIINSGQNIIIEKPACFGEFVQLANRVKIKELTSIGHNVTIGEDSIIEKSVIWDEIKIGAGCIIKESIICNNCEIGDNTLLERAIIAPNCKISSNSQIRDKTLKLGHEM
jgi:NDP-sugar pyrophosphorylase family protein